MDYTDNIKIEEEFSVREDGIYKTIIKEEIIGYGESDKWISDEYLYIPKEIFVEAYNKYIKGE